MTRPAPRRTMMQPSWRTAGMLLLLAGSVGVGVAGCNSEQPLVLLPMGVRRVPIDTTVPGEIAAGSYVAFGVPLPRDMTLTKRFADHVYATGRVEFEAVSNYFRDRLDAKQVETGPHRTLFVAATVTAAPGHVVDVDVRRRIGHVDIIVSDRTRPTAPKEPELTEKERWGRMGLTPDGKVLEEYAQ